MKPWTASADPFPGASEFGPAWKEAGSTKIGEESTSYRSCLQGLWRLANLVSDLSAIYLDFNSFLAMELSM